MITLLFISMVGFADQIKVSTDHPTSLAHATWTNIFSGQETVERSSGLIYNKKEKTVRVKKSALYAVNCSTFTESDYISGPYLRNSILKNGERISNSPYLSYLKKGDKIGCEMVQGNPQGNACYVKTSSLEIVEVEK